MSNLINESTIRNIVGVASFVGGLICFAFSSIYDKSFGKLGFGGLLVYLGISLSIFYLIWRFKRIPIVTETFQRVVEAILCVAICCISVALEELVPGKSDALGIISYGLFALMSVSKSRRSELGFDTGFFSLFLSLFLEQLIKTSLKLVPIALVFCLATILLRHRSQSGSPNRPEEIVRLIISHAPAPDVEAQYPPEESLSSIINEQNSQEETFETVSEENISDGGEQEEDIIAPLPDESPYPAGQRPVSSIMPGSPPPQFLRRRLEDLVGDGQTRRTPPPEHPRRRSTTRETAGRLPSRTPSPEYPRRRWVRERMTRAIQNFSSSLGDLLRRWHPPHLLFFFLIPDRI